MTDQARQMLAAFHSRPDGSDGRESRRWWAVDSDTGRVTEATGWSCAPNNPGTWWVPELGYSMSEGYSLFATKAEATARLRRELRDQISKAEERLARITD